MIGEGGRVSRRAALSHTNLLHDAAYCPTLLRPIELRASLGGSIGADMDEVLGDGPQLTCAAETVGNSVGRYPGCRAGDRLA